MRMLLILLLSSLFSINLMADAGGAYNFASGKAFYCVDRFEGTFKTQKYSTIPDRYATAIGCARYACENDQDTKYSFECQQLSPKSRPYQDHSAYQWKGNHPFCLIATKLISDSPQEYKSVMICERTLGDAQRYLNDDFSGYVEVGSFFDKDSRFCKDYGRTCSDY